MLFNTWTIFDGNARCRWLVYDGDGLWWRGMDYGDAGRTCPNDFSWDVVLTQRRFVAACERADAETARSILKANPNITASLPYQDQRLLTDAAWENDLEAVQVMLEAGFDPHMRGAEESTPLDRAAFHGFIDVVNLLLQHNPPLILKNCYGARPLDSAIYGSVHSWRRDGDYPATVEALIKAGSKVAADSVPSGNDAVDAILRRYLNDGVKEE